MLFLLQSPVEASIKTISSAVLSFATRGQPSTVRMTVLRKTDGYAVRFVKEGYGGVRFPPETSYSIKVQITNMLSLMEQCGPIFVEVMIISASIVFSMCAQESSVNAAS